MSRIAIAVDARELTAPLFPDDDVGQFVRLWADLESRMRGSVLRGGDRFAVHLDAGTLTVEVVSPADAVTVDAASRFAVVDVRERPLVHADHGCGTCRSEGRDTYGPFACRACPGPDAPVCDEHVVLLPGSLTPACPRHHPGCDACGDPAEVRCPGPHCNGRVGWCLRHSDEHVSEPRTRYCAECRTTLFPPCGAGACDAVGSIACDHLDMQGRPCPARRCPRHGMRWQVFGPHVQGLGRCGPHAQLSRLPPPGLLYQLLGACAVRGHWAPRVAGLRYMLMRMTRRHHTMSEVLALATAIPQAAPALHTELDALVRKRTPSWKREVGTSEGEREQAREALRDWLRREGHPQAADAVVDTSWAQPRDDRRGMLFVRRDDRLLPETLRKRASAALGIDVLLERYR